MFHAKQRTTPLAVGVASLVTRMAERDLIGSGIVVAPDPLSTVPTDQSFHLQAFPAECLSIKFLLLGDRKCSLAAAADKHGLFHTIVLL